MMVDCPPGFTVLVVEPDATCLAIISKMLSATKHQVVTAKGGLDALHIIWRKEVDIDLVLTEENLPDICKYDLLKAIKKLFYLPVVVMSGFNDDMVGSHDVGAKFHIVKPLAWKHIMDLWLYAVVPKWEKREKRELLPVLTGSSRGESSGIEKEYPERFLPSSRQKTVWTNDLHDRFLRVVQIIGMHDSDPSPEEILFYMNAPCLTREHISGHLRKYHLISRLEKDRILDAMTADDYSGLLPDQQTGGDCEHRQSLKSPTPPLLVSQCFVPQYNLLYYNHINHANGELCETGKRMRPGSIRWRLWHYNHGTASSSGSSATPCQQLVEQSPQPVKQEPEEDDQASQQLPSAPPPPEEQEEDDGDDSSSDDPDEI